MTSVFLSYARGDDGEPFDPASSFVARLHGAMTTAGFDVWFDRVSMPSRSLTFHQEIRDAVAACDRLVLVVGPKAAESLYVRQEWQFAYFEAEKIVTPILRCGDYGHVPDELKLLHCEDFRDDGQYDFHLKNLVRQLAEPAPALGKLIGVPSLPPHFLSRTDRLTALRDALRADLDRPVVITAAAARVGMHGMGGIGKSVLAATLSRDRKVREAFPDGIVWVGLGPLPTVADLQRRVHKDLGGDGAFQTEHEGRVKLRDILKDKSVLLILDDVWRRADVDWFDFLGPRCRAMITTRDAGLLTSLGGVHHQVELLTDAEALNLLAQAAGVERDRLPSEAADLIDECGRLPLAVALCGGLIRHGIAWAKVLEQLRTSRIDRIKDPHAAKVEHENIWNAIDVSVKFLSADEQARFLELAVFPPDEATPIAALRTLWSHTAGFDDWDTDALVIKLSQRSLLQLTASAQGKAFSLHVLVYDYVHRAAGDEAALHHRLLEAYRKKCPDGWHLDPPNDGYFFTHLRHHLIAAGRAGELADLLHELRWLEAKNEAGLTFDLTADFRDALSALPADDSRRKVLRLLDEALRRDIHFITRHAEHYPQGLFQCLWNSCWWYDCPEAARHYEPPNAGWPPDGPPWQRPGSKLWELLESWRKEKEGTKPGGLWVRSLRPPDLQLGAGQLVVLKGHQGSVTGVAFAPDGQRIASCSKDGTIRVWNSRNGAEVACICAGEPHSVAFAPDGRSIASTRGPDGGASCSGRVAFSLDGRWITSASASEVRIWDTHTGIERGCFGDSAQSYYGCSARVWEVESGREVACFRGHEMRVLSVAFAPDGQRVVSGGADGTIRIWEVQSGKQLACHGDSSDILRAVQSVNYSADGRRIVTVERCENELRVRQGRTGDQITRLKCSEWRVQVAAFSPDGHRIVAGFGSTVRMFDTRSGSEVGCFTGHAGDVNSVAFSPDGCHIASGSADGTVRIWDANWTARPPSPRNHSQAADFIMFSADGRRLITLAQHEPLGAWDTQDGRLVEWFGPSWADPVLAQMLGVATESIVCSRDGSRIVTLSRRGKVDVYDIEGRAGNRFSRDDEDIRFQNLGLPVQSQGVDAVAISPDGEQILCAAGSIEVWDVREGIKLPWTVDGQYICSRSWDGAEFIWDVQGNRCIKVIKDGEVSDDVRDSTAWEASPPRWRAFAQAMETAIEAVAAKETRAWVPASMNNITPHPAGRLWAGVAGKHLYLFTLEGNAPSAN